MRHPDVYIGVWEDPYLLRWWVIPKNRFFNIYLHHILKDDDKRALHDHPWANVSIILSGRYREITPTGSKEYGAGRIHFRRPTVAHRLEVVKGPVVTLFITGPKVRNWGFLCPKGWRPWQEFSAPNDKYRLGKGCDD